MTCPAVQNNRKAYCGRPLFTDTKPNQRQPTKQNICQDTDITIYLSITPSGSCLTPDLGIEVAYSIFEIMRKHGVIRTGGTSNS